MNAKLVAIFQNPLLLPGMLLGGLWILLCSSLSSHWLANEQYSYGWLVPPLALYLAFQRWNTRPAPGKPARWASLLLALSSLAFLPTWLVAQPNPDWRLINWLMSVEVVAFTLGMIALLGGSVWIRHFALPVCLILLAVPWPSGPEAEIIGGLMRHVAAATVATLNLSGVPALQHGNLIEIRTGMLGVDEACSGVRSLQATLMAAVAFGELYRFPAPQRVALLVVSLGIAFATNAVRAFLLAWNAARDGIEVVDTWHDPAGFGVMTVCFALVWGAAVVIGRDLSEPGLAKQVPAPNRPPAGVTLGYAVWFSAVFLATELWFGTHNAAAMGAPGWRFQWPVDSEHVSEVQEVPVAPAAAKMLQYDEGRGLSWKDTRGDQWLVYQMRWEGGPSRSRILARMHRPEHCLPSTGWELAQERQTLHVSVGELNLPFRAMRFTQGARNVHVWFCTVQETKAPEDESARWASIRSVLRRERRLGQQVLEVVLFSSVSGADADTEFQREIVPRLQLRVPK